MRHFVIIPPYMAVSTMAVSFNLKIMSKNPDLKKLGSNIAMIRKKKGLSQDDLAYDSDVGRRTINRIEVGETDARYSTLLKIAKTLGIKIKELVDY